MSAKISPGRDEKEGPNIFGPRRLTDESGNADSIAEIDGFRVLGLSQDDIDFYTGFSAKRRKRVVRKVSDTAPAELC